MTEYPLKARVWLRTSVEPHEWVLELESTINGVFSISRHTQPLSVAPEDVQGLDNLYERYGRMEETLQKIQDHYGVNHYSSWCRDLAKESLSE